MNRMIYLIKFATNAFTCFLILNFGSCLNVVQSSVHLKWNIYDNLTNNCTRFQFQCKNEQQIERNFFQCDNGACIDEVHKCDGIEQCCDGSDEWNQNCEKNSVENRKKRATSGNCVAPASSPDQTIVYECNADGNSGSCFVNGLIRETTVAKVVCNENYLAVDEPGYESICGRNKWYPKIKKCYKICNKLTPKNLDLECYRNNVQIDCKENTLRAGDKVKISCKPLHTFYGNVPPNHNEIICREDGSWNKDLFTCVPICGRSFTTASTLISNGVEEHFGDSPWHVAIYNKKKILICGGTIIHPLLVLSAAHCFYYENGKMQNSSDFEVVVSKVSRNYSIKDNEYQKAFKIKEIRFSDVKGYYSLTNYHSADIAILVLKEKITIGPTVLPACIDTARKKYYPPEGTLAKVVGWGMNEKGEYTERLHTANLPFIGRKRCLEIVDENFKPYITLDKFCAGSEEKDGAGVLQGDSGGGILFQELGFYFVRGIVSIKQPVDDAKVAAFTDLADHMDWILSVRDQFDQEGYEDHSAEQGPEVQLTDRLHYFDKELLLETYNRSSTGNVVLSPAGIKAMLAILLEGAAGNTELEIENALRLPQNKVSALAILQSQLKSIKNFKWEGSRSKINLFLDEDKYLSKKYSEILTKKYDAKFLNVPFTGQNESAFVHLLNAWINKDTRGVFTKLIMKEDFNHSANKLLMTHHIYGKIDCKFDIIAGMTQETGYFYSSNEKSTPAYVSYMTAEMRVGYLEDKEMDVRVAEMPLKEEHYTFTIFLPNKKNGITALLKNMLHFKLSDLFSKLVEVTKNVTLPIATIELKTPLKNIFSSFGIYIGDALTSKTNLSGILATQDRIEVEEMFQIARIEFNEVESETASSGKKPLRKRLPEPMDFKANHSFVYIIRDKRESDFLFVGVVSSIDGSTIKRSSSNQMNAQTINNRIMGTYQPPRPTEKGSVEYPILKFEDRPNDQSSTSSSIPSSFSTTVSNQRLIPSISPKQPTTNNKQSSSNRTNAQSTNNRPHIGYQLPRPPEKGSVEYPIRQE